jgi:hypothetical protein
MTGGLMACGSGGDGGGGGASSNASPTSTGTFVDAPVQGITVQSGNISSVSDLNGLFSYAPGQQATFKIGNVSLGSATVSQQNAVVSPLNLVPLPNQSANDPGVANRLRFIQLLDADQDPANGISIPMTVLQGAQTWPQLVFDQDTNTFVLPQPIILTLQNAQLPTTLPTANDATTAFTSGLFCALGGFYSGTFTGSDTGPFAIGIDPTNGALKGAGFSQSDQALFALSGNLNADAPHSIAFGAASTGASFNGTVSATGASGTWQNAPDSGSYSGSKLVLPAGAAGAIYRGVGFADNAPNGDPGDLGPFVMVINGTVASGSGFSFADQSIFPLNGTFDAGTSTVTATDGANLTITAQIVNGSFQGTFNDPVEGVSGILRACRTPS